MFFGYLEWMHDKVLYRKTYFVHGERVPEEGRALVVVSNHQNALNDPLAIEFAFSSRIVNIFARGDIFSNRLVGSFLKSLYILPAYRMRTDGIEQVEKNYESFEEAHARLLHGGTVAIFPEGTNQDRRYLGDFSLGYLRMAFGAAEKSGFEREIWILPTANHYSNYFHVQSDMMISCGEPISLKPYYELYKTKPRTAQREVNHRVRAAIEGLMLDIRDTENYDAIDYIRESYGVEWARRRGLNPKVLPEKLDADRAMVKRLDEWKAEEPEVVQGVYEDVRRLKAMTEAKRVRDWNFDHRYSRVRQVAGGVGFLVLLPLFLFALIPNVAAYYAPKRLVRRFEEMGSAFKMFAGGVQFVLNSIVVLPLCYAAVFVADLLLIHWAFAVAHLLLLPWLGVGAWHYRIWWIKWRSVNRYERARRRGEMKEAEELRRKIWRKLDEALQSE